MSGLLSQVDSNIPAPTARQSRAERSGGRRRPRALSPAAEPTIKRQKRLGTRLSSPPPPNLDSDDSFMPLLDDEPAGVPMSDPAPSSPAAKAAERKAQLKREPKEQYDDDDIDMMEVAHAGAVKMASVNLTGARPIKKPLDTELYPSPASSSPPKVVAAQSDVVDSSSWNDLTQRLNVMSSPQTEARGIGKIDHGDAVEADGSLNFFWTDYMEVNGSLCLFGKVLNKKTKSYVSCFVKIDNILRKLYFLPRPHRVRQGEDTGEEVGMMDVYEEVDALMTKMQVGMHKIKQCSRKYAFELPGIPKDAQYMKLLYGYTSQSPPIPPTLAFLPDADRISRAST